MFKRITMGDYRTVAKDFDKRMAKTEGLPLWLRVVHAAGAEMNRSGHAYFGGWQNLADYVRVDGKPMPLRAKVYEAVKKAVELGYLSPDSDVDCLVFNSADSQKAAHSGYGCKNPKHKDVCRTAEEIAEALADLEEELEVPVGVDPLTGEVLEEVEEASESVSEETPVVEDQEVLEEPEIGAQSLVEASEEPAETPAEEDDLNFDDIEWDIEDAVELPAVEVEEPAKDITETEFFDWFDGLSDLGQDVAYLGFTQMKHHSLSLVQAVVTEALTEKHDEWGTNVSMRYCYAHKAIADNYNGPEKRLEKVEVSAGLMDEEW